MYLVKRIRVQRVLLLVVPVLLSPCTRQHLPVVLLTSGVLLSLRPCCRHGAYQWPSHGPWQDLLHTWTVQHWQQRKYCTGVGCILMILLNALIHLHSIMVCLVHSAGRGAQLRHLAR